MAVVYVGRILGSQASGHASNDEESKRLCRETGTGRVEGHVSTHAAY